MDPKLTSFEPRIGLREWGSTVTVYGENLDAGNEVLLSVAGSECTVERLVVVSVESNIWKSWNQRNKNGR